VAEFYVLNLNHGCSLEVSTMPKKDMS